VRLIVLTDSLVLLTRVALRRLALGARGFRRFPSDTTVLYIDCGVHVDGRELVWLQEWLSGRSALRILAFEAGRQQFVRAAKKLDGTPGLDLRHGALVGPLHRGPTAELHVGNDGGLGASLFSARGDTVEEVPAVRLSDVLSTVSPPPAVTILRMNIEGAESFVIEDLLESGLHTWIDGYYGMWDDLSKIDPALDREFRALLEANRIHTIPFNSRDLDHWIRRLAIRTDIETSIRRTLRRHH
jgi:FkbM family methyltransferase